MTAAFERGASALTSQQSKATLSLSQLERPRWAHRIRGSLVGAVLSGQSMYVAQMAGGQL
jgi:hypothetical protein